MAYGHGCCKRSPRPGEGNPKDGAHVLALCTTPCQLAFFVALALQQHGQQPALCKGSGLIFSSCNLSILPCPKDSLIYIVGEYGLGVFSERLTVSCLANPRLGTVANDVQHPDRVEPNGNCPTCDSYELRLAELLGLSHQTKSAIPSVAASEALREIAWESNRQFA